MTDINLQEDTVSADRKERLIFDPRTGKSRKVTSVMHRQNFNNAKYGNRNSQIEFVDGKDTPPEEEDKKMKKEELSKIASIVLEAKKKKKETCAEELALEQEEAELTRQLHEVLSADAAAADWIHDFVHSENPKFEGKSKKERIKMALGAYYNKQKNEEVEHQEVTMEEACKSIAKSVTQKKEDLPFEPDAPKKNPSATAGKYGQGYSTARHLARQGMAKQMTKEEIEIEEGLEVKSFTEFVDQLLEYTPGPGGVTRVQGRSYGAQYHDPEGDDDAWENEGKAKPAAPAPTVKRGRGRPAGSYGTYKARSAETKAAAAAKSAASKAANKAKAK